MVDSYFLMQLEFEFDSSVLWWRSTQLVTYRVLTSAHISWLSLWFLLRESSSFYATWNIVFQLASKTDSCWYHGPCKCHLPVVKFAANVVGYIEHHVDHHYCQDVSWNTWTPLVKEPESHCNIHLTDNWFVNTFKI